MVYINFKHFSPTRIREWLSIKFFYQIVSALAMLGLVFPQQASSFDAG
jgi:hypothetical protein